MAQFGMLIGHLKNVFPDYATKPPPIADLQVSVLSALLYQHYHYTFINMLTPLVA